MNESLECLLAVADGMGGHRAGEIASSITINHLTKSFQDKISVGTKDEAINFLKQAVSEANERYMLIQKKIQNQKEWEQRL